MINLKKKNIGYGEFNLRMTNQLQISIDKKFLDILGESTLAFLTKLMIFKWVFVFENFHKIQDN